MKQIDSEKDVEAKLFNLIKKQGGMCIKLLCTYLTGLPDRMVLMPMGRIYFVELKTTGKKPRPSQLLIHEKLRKLGFEVLVIDTLQGVTEFVNSITKKV